MYKRVSIILLINRLSSSDVYRPAILSSDIILGSHYIDAFIDEFSSDHPCSILHIKHTTKDILFIKFAILIMMNNYDE